MNANDRALARVRPSSAPARPLRPRRARRERPGRQSSQYHYITTHRRVRELECEVSAAPEDCAKKFKEERSQRVGDKMSGCLCSELMNAARGTWRPDSLPSRRGGAELHAGGGKARHIAVCVKPHHQTFGGPSRFAAAHPDDPERGPDRGGRAAARTLRPAFDDIHAKLSALSELRYKPAGTIRITTNKHAAEAILWPVLGPLLRDYPDVNVELTIDQSLHQHRRRAIRRGRSPWRTGRKGHDCRSHRARSEHGSRGCTVGTSLNMRPQKNPHDLTEHRCINLRLPTAGGLYIWEVEKDGRELNVRVQGQLVFNYIPLVLNAAAAGFGLACVFDDQVQNYIAEGRLVRYLRTGALCLRAITSTTRAAGSRRPPSPCWWRRCAGGRYRGQRQRWYALRFTGEDKDMRLDLDPHPEFDAWRSAPLAEFPRSRWSSSGRSTRYSRGHSRCSGPPGDEARRTGFVDRIFGSCAPAL